MRLKQKRKRISVWSTVCAVGICADVRTALGLAQRKSSYIFVVIFLFVFCIEPTLLFFFIYDTAVLLCVNCTAHTSSCLFMVVLAGIRTFPVPCTIIPSDLLALLDCAGRHECKFAVPSTRMPCISNDAVCLAIHARRFIRNWRNVRNTICVWRRKRTCKETTR